jgi:hypothetical protein
MAFLRQLVHCFPHLRFQYLPSPLPPESYSLQMSSTIKLSETKKRSLTTVCEELLAPHVENGLVVEVDFSVPVVHDTQKVEAKETPANKKVCVLRPATQAKGGKGVQEFPSQIRHVVCTHCDLLYTLEESIPPTKQCVSNPLLRRGTLPLTSRSLTVEPHSFVQIDCGRSATWKLCNPIAGCHCLSQLSRDMRDLYSKAMQM